MKRFFYSSFVLLLALALVALTACGSNGSSGNSSSKGGDNGSSSSSSGGSSSKNVTIKFMTISLSPTFDDYFKNAIQTFENNNPGITVKQDDQPYDQIQQILVTKASSGSLDDVLNLNTDFTKKLGGLGALVNMDKAAADVKDSYFSGLWKSGQVHGTTYSLPWYVTTDALLYNKKIFKAAGIQAPPKTFKEAVKDSEIIKQKTGKYGYTLNTAPYLLLELDGVSILSKDGKKAAFNTQKAVDLWTFLKKEYDKGVFSKDVILGTAKVPELYAKGNVAMWSTGPQLFRQVKKLSPEIYKESAAAPALVTDANVTHASIMDVAVSKKSKHKDAAVKFAKFITNSENQLAFAKAANILPSVKKAANSDYFNKGKNSDDPAKKGNYFAAQTLSKAVDTTVPDENATKIEKVISDSFQEVLLKNKDPKKALSDAANQVNSIISQE